MYKPLLMSLVKLLVALCCITCVISKKDLTKNQNMDLKQMETMMKPLFEKIYQNVILKHSKYEKFKDSPQDLLKELEKDPEVFQEMVQVAMRELSQGDITKFMEVMNPDIMDAQMQHFMGEVRNLFNKFDTEGKGYLVNNQLFQIIRTFDVERKLTNTQITNLINEADNNQSANIDFNEFVKLITKVQKHIIAGQPIPNGKKTEL